MSDHQTWSLDKAFAYCRHITKNHYENYTVGSILLPRSKRQHLANLYSYARYVDDLGDESKGNRPQLLDEWQEELNRCYKDVPRHPIMLALQNTINTFNIPIEPFLKLINANRMDQIINRYPTFQDLLHYCDHSANPCGHLFLYLFNHRDQCRQKLADYTCTALQLANFLQDVVRDYNMNRLYLPLEDLDRFGYTETELSGSVFNDSFRNLVEFQVNRTRIMFQKGLDLVDCIDGAAKLDVILFNRGGLAILDRIEKMGYNVLGERPHLSKFQKSRILLSSWLGMMLGKKPQVKTSK